jgi:hypothetical protein
MYVVYVIVILCSLIWLLLRHSHHFHKRETYNPGQLQDSSTNNCLIYKDDNFDFAACSPLNPTMSMDVNPVNILSSMAESNKQQLQQQPTSIVSQETLLFSFPEQHGCLETDGSYVYLTPCDDMNINQSWYLQNGKLSSVVNNLCVDSSIGIRMLPCSESSSTFKFMPSTMSEEEIQNYILQEQNINNPSVEAAMRTNYAEGE